MPEAMSDAFLESDGDEILEHERIAARRIFNTLLRYWSACPKRRCRRARRCCGEVDFCHAIFWPVVSEDFKVWWRAMGDARRDRSSLRQAIRYANSELAGWRRRQPPPAADAE